MHNKPIRPAAQISQELQTLAVRAEEDRLWRMKLEWRRQSRPTDLALMCCDYARAEQEYAAGMPGKAEFGGRHVCDRCAGLEYWDDDGRNWE